MKSVLKTSLIVVMAVALLAAGIVAAFQAAWDSARRAGECAVGGTILAPLNITVEGVKLTDGIIDGAIGIGGDILGSLSGIVGIGDNDDLGLSLEQLENAAIIVGIGEVRGESPRLIQVALMTSLQEASLINVPYGDADSLGLFQQRPSQGWGSADEIMDPVFATNAFFNALHDQLSAEQASQLPLWEIAANVQKPREDLRQEYDKWQDEAAELLESMLEVSGVTVALIGGTKTVEMHTSVSRNMLQSGWPDAIIDAASDRLIATDVEDGPASGIEAIQTYLEADQQVVMWAVDLGSSELDSFETEEQASDSIRSLLDATPEDSHLAWVNISDPGNVQAALFNRALETVADEHDRLGVIDWDSVASGVAGLRKPDGSYNAAGLDQRASFISRVFTNPSSIGVFDDVGFFPPGFGGGFRIPGACDFGGTVVGGALEVLQGQVGLPFTSDPDQASDQSLFEWVFAEQGEDLGELLEGGRDLTSFNDAQIGDLVLWADNPDDLTDITRTGIYLGANMVVMEPQAGDVTSISQMDWSNVIRVVRIELDVLGENVASIPPLDYSDTVVAAGFRVHPALESRVERLVEEAAAEGFTLTGGAWRSNRDQINLRREHCGISRYDVYDKPSDECTPPTARPYQPGRTTGSMHIRGLALDLSCDGELITSRNNDCFRWLSGNAERIAGLQNLPSEPWHWSTNGS